VAQGTLDEVRASGTLEESFIRAVGEEQAERPVLSWLETAAKGNAGER
jgi:hypothetical protein